MTQTLVYFGLAEQDGRPVKARRPSLGWMIGISIVWGLLFPWLDGHPRGYLRDVLIDTVLMFAVQLVIYGLAARKQRRA